MLILQHGIHLCSCGNSGFGLSLSLKSSAGMNTDVCHAVVSTFTKELGSALACNTSDASPSNPCDVCGFGFSISDGWSEGLGGWVISWKSVQCISVGEESMSLKCEHYLHT